MKKILTMALISILTLSGCGLFGGGEEVNQPTVSGIDADSLLDDQLYQLAVNTSDAGECEKIENSQKSEECADVVEAMALSKKAKEEMDLSNCDDIKLDRYKENCEDEVKVLEKAEQAEETNKKIEEEALEKQDVSICDQLEENDKYSCQYNILANKAIENNDETVCDQIESEQFKTECKNNLETIESEQ